MSLRVLAAPYPEPFVSALCCVLSWTWILEYLEESYLRVFCWIDAVFLFFFKSKVLSHILMTVAFSHSSAPTVGLGYKY